MISTVEKTERMYSLEEVKELLDVSDKLYAEINQELQFMHKNLDFIGQRIDFLKGLLVGLFFGIAGNMFVQHWYQVFEGLILGKFDTIFFSNVTVFIVGLVVICIITVILYRRITRYEKARMLEWETLKKMIEEKYERRILPILRKMGLQ